MTYLGVLSLLKILQNSSCSYNSRLQMVHTKALKVLYVEVVQKFLFRSLLCKHPIVELEGEVFCAKVALKVLFFVSVVEHFLGHKVAKQLLYIVCGSLTSKEFASRDIEESNTHR